MILDGKNVVLGVSGGIAAYKACEIVSRLKKLGANVDVIMTKSAAEFVTPLTFQSLSLNKVTVDMFEEPKYWEIGHISLAKKADLFLIAPATANIIGKLAGGIADDMLSTTAMATKAPVLIAPAMNTNMYENVAVQENIEKLRKRGMHFINPIEGLLACGDVGAGKLPDPVDIVNRAIELLTQKKDLLGIRIMVTAGPTKEKFDPVRFITNNSTGKMGFAIAEKAAARGAEVLLISGPTNVKKPVGMKLIAVESALDMRNAVMENLEAVDAVIKSAAVSDYRPEEVKANKIKKAGDTLTLNLVKNPDIIAEVGARKGNRVIIGFAMETEDLVQHAKEKLEKKNLDMIVANDLMTEGAGFGVDTNVVTLLHRDGKIENIEKLPKEELADIILDRMLEIKMKNEKIIK